MALGHSNNIDNIGEKGNEQMFPTSSNPPTRLGFALGTQTNATRLNGCGKLASTLVFLAIHFFVNPASAGYITFTGRTFGTSYMIKVIDEQPIEAEKLESTILQRLDEIDAKMSTWREDSEVVQFNKAPAGEWFAVSSETAELVGHAIELSEETQGAFDVTVGPAVALWNFGAQTQDQFRIPTDEQINTTLERIGYQKLATRAEPPGLKKSVGGLEIDLSAIAKGYAVDAVAELLDEYPNFMIEIGGEIRTKGSRDLGRGWRIGLEAPVRNERRVDSTINLHDDAMATSGDYRSFHMHNGKTYSHTIDPQTARPVEHQLAAVTVLAKDCTTADAMATALLVMGPEKGQEFANEHNVRALLISRVSNEGNEEYSRTVAANFPTAAEEQTAAPGYWKTFLITAAVFGLAIVAMSIGTIIANRRLQGSCGGMAGIKDAGGNTICDMCTKPSPECTGEPTDATQAV